MLAYLLNASASSRPLIAGLALLGVVSRSSELLCNSSTANEVTKANEFRAPE